MRFRGFGPRACFGVEFQGFAYTGCRCFRLAAPGADALPVAVMVSGAFRVQGFGFSGLRVLADGL